MQDWLNQEDASDVGYKYFMRADPDMRQMLGPIEEVDDEWFGRPVRSRWAKIAMMRGSTTYQEVRVYLEPVPHVRLDTAQSLRGWYSSKGDGKVRGKRERPCMTDAVLTSPYGGTCETSCGFCYINSGGRGYRGTGLTTVPLNYGQQVRKQLKSMMSSQAGYFTSFHEPFNSLEPIYHNTQSGSSAFVEEGLPIFFLSRNQYPGWALDLITKNKHSYAQMSINTPDEDDWRKLSPRALPLAGHMDQIRDMRKLGIYVSIQCNPIVAGIVTHEDVEKLFEMLGSAGANHVIVKFVEANFPYASAMVERMEKRFGANRAASFKELFVENNAGQQKTIVEGYRREGHERYRKKATECGMTYSTCFEYTKKDGSWVSMGPEFTTADTCHGHRVPFYVRQAAGQPFAPLGACAPSGCLSCASDNGGSSRCGSELLGSAKALQFSDLKQNPGVTRW